MSQDLYAESLKTFMLPIAEYIDDSSVSEVMINGYQDVYVERKGKITKVESRFDERGLMTLAVNIAQYVGRQLNNENPRLDARLPDGSRIHIVIPPIAKNGIIVSIRKFFKEKLDVPRLIEFGSFTKEAARFIQVCVELQKNMIISGGTGSGKTTLLNVLSNYIPADQRILTMEDALELQLANEHVVRFETRPPDKQGKGRVSMGDLLHSALRLRPDRIILGEVRGEECFDLLQAMNTGHGGSMATVHANTPIETLSRLESLVLLGGIELPLRAIRSQVSSAINIVISASRYSDGSRRVSHISEILPLDKAGEYQVQDIFIYTQTHKDPDGKIHGYFAPTGVIPTFFRKIVASGFKDVREEFFNPDTYKLTPPPYYMGQSAFHKKIEDEKDSKKNEDSKELKAPTTEEANNKPLQKIEKSETPLAENKVSTAILEKKKVDEEKIDDFNIDEFEKKIDKVEQLNSIKSPYVEKAKPKGDLDFDFDMNPPKKETIPPIPQKVTKPKVEEDDDWADF
ncbi:CpaF family protein [bacterium]|nr:CpaF family protein [bacterium]